MTKKNSNEFVQLNKDEQEKLIGGFYSYKQINNRLSSHNSGTTCSNSENCDKANNKAAACNNKGCAFN